jgi:hypothetical protein
LQPFPNPSSFISDAEREAWQASPQGQKAREEQAVLAAKIAARKAEREAERDAKAEEAAARKENAEALRAASAAVKKNAREAAAAHRAAAAAAATAAAAAAEAAADDFMRAFVNQVRASPLTLEDVNAAAEEALSTAHLDVSGARRAICARLFALEDSMAEARVNALTAADFKSGVGFTQLGNTCWAAASMAFVADLLEARREQHACAGAACSLCLHLRRFAVMQLRPLPLSVAITKAAKNVMYPYFKTLQPEYVAGKRNNALVPLNVLLCILPGTGITLEKRTSFLCAQ